MVARVLVALLLPTLAFCAVGLGVCAQSLVAPVGMANAPDGLPLREDVQEPVAKPKPIKQSPLAYAIVRGEQTEFESFLKIGANPDQGIYVPVEPEFLELIEDEKLRFYLEYEKGMTILMLAAAMGRTEFVDLLLRREANKGLRTEKYKMVALSFAQRSNRTQSILLLLGKPSKPSKYAPRIEVILGAQQAVFYQHGVELFRTKISSGKHGYATPTGEFVITDKQRVRRSSIYEVNMPYFMRLNGSVIGMHAGYVPDYPASHGCIRLPRSVAKKLFKQAEVGTIVTIRQ